MTMMATCGCGKHATDWWGDECSGVPVCDECRDRAARSGRLIRNVADIEAVLGYPAKSRLVTDFAR